MCHSQTSVAYYWHIFSVLPASLAEFENLICVKMKGFDGGHPAIGTFSVDVCASDALVTVGCVRFVCKNNGVLFESDLIQVGVKCEFRQHLARLSLFYGNKTAVALKDFQPVVNSEPPLSNHILSY